MRKAKSRLICFIDDNGTNIFRVLECFLSPQFMRSAFEGSCFIVCTPLKTYGGCVCMVSLTMPMKSRTVYKWHATQTGKCFESKCDYVVTSMWPKNITNRRWYVWSVHQIKVWDGQIIPLFSWTKYKCISNLSGICSAVLLQRWFKKWTVISFVVLTVQKRDIETLPCIPSACRVLNKNETHVGVAMHKPDDHQKKNNPSMQKI